MVSQEQYQYTRLGVYLVINQELIFVIVSHKNAYYGFLFELLISTHNTHFSWQNNPSTTTKWAASYENRSFAYAKTKTQISFAVTAKLISAFVFAT